MNWSSLETLGTRGAVRAVWEKLTGEPLEALWFLRPAGREAALYPCPCECGCQHEVVRHAGGPLIAACTCKGLGGCEDLGLVPEQVRVHELNPGALGRAIVRALGCDARFAPGSCECCWQIGAYSPAAVPMLLLVASEPQHFRAAVAELTARLRNRFMLFAPTSRFMDARSRELLTNSQAGFFDLQSQFRLGPKGTLHSVRPPGDLLRAFAPEAAEYDEDAARRAFALIQRLDSASPGRSSGVLTVFRLYCGDGLAAEQVAKVCGCSKGTVMNRLKAIRKVTGVKPEELRRFSAHFSAIETAATDSRAAHIHRRSLIDDAEEEEDA